MDNKLINFKLQFGLAFIPYFGWAVVILTSFYNIKKLKNFAYIVLYYAITLVPFIILFAIEFVIASNFIMDKSANIITIFYILSSFVLFLCIALADYGIERAMINRILKNK